MLKHDIQLTNVDITNVVFILVIKYYKVILSMKNEMGREREGEVCF